MHASYFLIRACMRLSAACVVDADFKEGVWSRLVRVRRITVEKPTWDIAGHAVFRHLRAGAVFVHAEVELSSEEAPVTRGGGRFASVVGLLRNEGDLSLLSKAEWRFALRSAFKNRSSPCLLQSRLRSSDFSTAQPGDSSGEASSSALLEQAPQEVDLQLETEEGPFEERHFPASTDSDFVVSLACPGMPLVENAPLRASASSRLAKAERGRLHHSSLTHWKQSRGLCVFANSGIFEKHESYCL